MEIERKWLIDKNKLPYDIGTLKHYEIVQAYISFSPTIRIRKIINYGRNILTIKGSSHDKGLSRQEYEIDITDKQFDSLMEKCEGLILYKTRYMVKEEDLLYEIDFFHEEYEGLAYMEIEFQDKEKARNYPDPAWAIRDVTYDKRFSNASLAKGTEIEF